MFPPKYIIYPHFGGFYEKSLFSGNNGPDGINSFRPGRATAYGNSSETDAELPGNSTIAVLSVSSNNIEMATFAVDELEYQLVLTKRFTVVDRTTLDKIRAEQQFQLSGDVSDQSAVSIGNMLGAGIVITGSISGSGSTQRLTLKALDVKTAQIITMAREQF
jgi:TolB-like protein